MPRSSLFRVTVESRIGDDSQEVKATAPRIAINKALPRLGGDQQLGVDETLPVVCTRLKEAKDGEAIYAGPDVPE